MKKKQFFKRPLFLVPASLAGIFVILVVYLAYAYIPPEDRSYIPSYLKTIDSEFITTDTFKIHYIHKGEGRPVILIHGDCAWLNSFQHNFETLSETFSVYAIDMPGHGYSIPLCESPVYDLDMMSDAILNFVDIKKIQKASLVGHSAGGGWAMHFASRHPDRVDRLVLIDSNGLDAPVTLTFKLFTFPVVGELFSKFFTYDDVKKGCEDSFYDKRLVTDEMIRDVMAPLTFYHNRVAQYRCIRNQDWKITEKAMPEIHTQKLVIWGKNDQYLDCRMAEQFKEMMPNTEVVLLDNCGHSAQEEKPAKVNELIVSFLSQ